MNLKKDHALFFFNDDLALGGMIALKKNGLMPGHDLAVVGFDGIPEGELSSPTLTTVDCFSQLLGIHAVRLLMKRMNNPDLERQAIILPPKLVVRESCSYKKRFIKGRASEAVVAPSRVK